MADEKKAAEAADEKENKTPQKKTPAKKAPAKKKSPQVVDPEGEVMDSKKMLKEHGAKGTKINQNERKTIRITKDTRYHKKGQITSPHPVVADQFIKQGFAEEYKEKKKK